jgi:hypothetical protein
MFWKTNNRAPEKGWAIFVSEYIVLDACCHKGFTFLEYVSKEDSFEIHHDHIQWKKNSWLFFIIFWNWTLKCYKNCFTDSEKFETTKYTKLNKGKWDSRNEIKKNYKTKRNFTSDATKGNETKRNFAVYFVSRNKRNFAKQFFCFALFRVLRNKKRMRNGNPNSTSVYLEAFFSRLPCGYHWKACSCAVKCWLLCSCWRKKIMGPRGFDLRPKMHQPLHSNK